MTTDNQGQLDVAVGGLLTDEADAVGNIANALMRRFGKGEMANMIMGEMDQRHLR